MKSLGKVTSKMPFFNVPLTIVPHKTLTMLLAWLLMAQIWILFFFSNLKSKKNLSYWTCSLIFFKSNARVVFPRWLAKFVSTILCCVICVLIELYITIDQWSIVGSWVHKSSHAQHVNPMLKTNNTMVAI